MIKSWHCIDIIDIYFLFKIDKLFITVPLNNVFNKECLVINQKITIFKNKYNITLNNTLKLFNITTNKDIFVYEIPINLYYNIIFLYNNRRKLLFEEYCTTQYTNTISFFYDVKDKRYHDVRILVKKNNISNKLNTLEKALEILFFISDNYKHNGEIILPNNRNIKRLLQTAEKNNGYLNCRGLAILMNQVCMAYGILSRFIICMPKEKYINDCHVVVIIYFKEKKKWVMLDPSYKAYFMNSKHELLSLEEIREYLKQGKKIIINNEANISGKKLNEELYFRSLIKKMYRFQSPIIINAECDKESNFIELLPQKSGNCQITNPKDFWKIPD